MLILIAIIIYILYREYVRDKAKAAKQNASPLMVRTTHPDRSRLYFLGSFIVGVWATTFIWLNFGWYRIYKRSNFHWFDDRGEWNHIDKAGHVFGAYFQTVWAYELLRWAGLDNKRAAFTAAFIGCGFESSIEVWDGFSTKWGASWSDLVANFIGASMALTQYLIWKEQRMICKYSYEGGDYPEGELKERADELFGKSFFEKTIKDYNHLTLWISVNPSKFIPAIKPDWLCVSVGYGVENLYGGFENKWVDKDGKQHDRSDLQRLKVLKFSLDGDLVRLKKNNNPYENIAFNMLNVFKMPFPALKKKF